MNCFAFACLVLCCAGTQAFNPLLTITRTVLSTVTSNVRSTCFEIVDVKPCRKKRQGGFFFPYYYVDSGVQNMDYQLPAYARPRTHELAFSDETEFVKQSPSSSIESSFDEAQRGGLAEARGFNLVSFTTSTGYTTVTSAVAGTQTLIVSCVASGLTIPTPLCNIEAIFPPRPASMTLAQYCSVLGNAAKMRVIECREITSRKARKSIGGRVLLIFAQLDGGDFPSRSKIASNIIAALVPVGNIFTLPGLPSDFEFSATSILVSSTNIFVAVGQSTSCLNGDLTCGPTGAGTCRSSSGCVCNSGYTRSGAICVKTTPSTETPTTTAAPEATESTIVTIPTTTEIPTTTVVATATKSSTIVPTTTETPTTNVETTTEESITTMPATTEAPTTIIATTTEDSSTTVQSTTGAPTICPAGYRMAVVTTEPATTEAPTTSVATTTAASSTTVPTTSEAPTTTVATTTAEPSTTVPATTGAPTTSITTAATQPSTTVPVTTGAPTACVPAG